MTVVVVLIVVVAAFALTRHSASPAPAATASYGPPMKYSQTTAATTSALASAVDGPWTLVAVYGLGIGQNESSGTSASALGITGCTLIWTTPTSLVLPGTEAGAPAGQVAGWIDFSLDSQGYALMTLVSSISSEVVGSNVEVVSGSCFSFLTGFGPLASGPVDSPIVAKSANGAGGSGFLARNPGATVEFLLFESDWVVLYSTCSFVATGGSGTEWGALFNATTGAAIGSPSTTSVTC